MRSFHNLFMFKDLVGGVYQRCKALVDLGDIKAGWAFIDCTISPEGVEPTLHCRMNDGHMVHVPLIVALKDVHKGLKVYLAGPWFHEGQLERLERVKQMLVDKGFKVFSPKDEIMFEPGVTTPQMILDKNTEAIDNCDLILVITDGKDVGTMFEAGYACATFTKILYFWELPQGKFNVMLGATGDVAMGWDELDDALESIKSHGEARGLRGVSQENME